MNKFIVIVLCLILIMGIAYLYVMKTWNDTDKDLEEMYKEKIEGLEKEQDSLETQVPQLKEIVKRETFTFRKESNKITHLLAHPLGDTLTYDQQVKDSVRAFLQHTL